MCTLYLYCYHKVLRQTFGTWTIVRTLVRGLTFIEEFELTIAYVLECAFERCQGLTFMEEFELTI